MTYLDDVTSPAATEHAVSDPVSLVRQMVNVKDQIRGCTRCPLHRVSTPVPFRGPAPAPITIVGEAPGPREEQAGEPFVGPAGRKLDELMQQTLGFTSSRCLVANTVSCLPRDVAGGRFRAPRPYEKEACQRNLQAQLALGDSPYILSLGRHALNAFRPDRAIGQVHGRPMWWPEGTHNRIVFATFHPSAALRQKTYERAIIIDLSYLRVLLDNPGAKWIETCVVCQSADVDYADLYGMYYCAEHVPAKVSASATRRGDTE